MRQYIIPFVAFFLWNTAAVAQNCGCQQAGNCPYEFDEGTSTTVCYDFAGIFNNDLADPAQGVCGVRIRFEQDYVWQLELSLTSPSGQTVQLVGENEGCGSGGTNLTTWDVLFVPCSETAEPEMPYSATWDNCQNWPFIGQIGGSYYPHNGCLEDFNTGPVDGTWCLDVNNLSFADGTIFEFEIILCDETGVNCCDADAGDVDGSIEACEGETSLAFTPIVDYFGLSPDPAEYGYVFLISNENGVILDTTSTPDLTAYEAGNYSVCGLSYLLAEAANIPEPDGVLTIADLIADLEGFTPSFCGEVSSDCVPIVINEIPEPANLTEMICEGDSIIVGDTTIYHSGNYEINIQTTADCDSTIFLDLQVLTRDTGFVIETICLGDSLVVADTAFYATGMYEVLVEDVSFCDSLYLIDLTVLDPIFETISDTICFGEVYEFGDQMLTDAGMYTDTFPSFQMCDSIVDLTLTVLNIQANIALPDTITCNVPQITLDGTASTDNATYFWEAISGTIVGTTNDETAVVSSGGEYQLTVTMGDCSDVATVMVEEQTNAPFADAGTATSLSCDIESMQLDGSNSDSGQFIDYQWITNGGIIDENATTIMPTISGAPATYSIIVTNSQTGCADTSAVFVDFDGVLPMVNAGADITIDCSNPTVTLDGSDSETDDSFQFSWTNLAGASFPLIGVTNSETNIADQYILTVLNEDNGCFASDTVQVFENQNAPIVNAGMDDSLTCNVTEIMLQGEVQNSTNFEVEWTDLDGNFLSSNLTPLVNLPACYILIINDLDNGCPARDTVCITENTTPPIAEIGLANITLDCANPSYNFGENTNTSQGAEYSYEWFLNSISVSQNATYLGNESGDLEFVVTNNSTGCADTTQAQITVDTLAPIVNAGADMTIDCANETVVLDGSNSEINANFTYTWADIAGQNYPITNPLTNSETSTTGIYILTVFNAENSCSAMDTMEVDIDQNPPLVNAGLDDTLTCQITEIQLQGEVQNSTNFTVEWTDLDGNFISNSLNPIVNEADCYILIINDLDNGCLAQDTVCIAENITLPNAEAGVPSFTLNCAVNCWTFGDENDTTQGDEITYEWYLNDALIGNELAQEICEGGELIFVVTNTETGCSTNDTVQVTANFLTPLTNINAPTTELGCTTPQIILDGEETSGQPDIFLEYEWYNGNDLVGLNDDYVALDAGEYCLIIENTFNFCQDTICITITENPNLPEADAGPEMVLDCDTGEVTLQGDGSMGNYTYNWTGPASADIQNETTLTPTVNAVGIYQLEVFDVANNCSAFSETTVSIDTSACLPIADIQPGDEIFGNGMDGIIDCNSGTVTIGGQQEFCGHFGRFQLFFWHKY